MFQRKRSVLIFLIPGLSLLAVFYFVPFLIGLRYSLMGGAKMSSYIGAANYQSLWKNKMFLLGLKNTLALCGICAPLLWGVAFAFSLFLQSIHPKGALFRKIALTPYMAPSSAMVLIWLLIFDYGGWINHLLQAIGLNRVLWLESSALRFPVIVMFIWKNLGFCIVLFLTALQTVPQALYEYARLEGAGFLARALKISLPQILPTAFLIFVIAWINAFRIFKEAYIIAGAYPDASAYTLQHYMNNMFTRLDYPMATAAAYSFAAIVFTLFAILFLLQRYATQGAQ